MWLAAAVLLALAATGRAMAADSGPPLAGPLPAASVLGPAPGWPRDLSPQVEVLEDPHGRLQLPEVLALPLQQWRAGGATPLNPGFSRSVWWLRVRLQHPLPADTPAQAVLELAQPLHDDVQVWLVHAGARQPLRAWHTGDRQPFASRPVAHPHWLFPLRLEAGEMVEVYLRLASADGLHEAAQLRLWEPQSLLESAGRERFAYGLYYGALLALLLYNLFLYASTRTALHAHYAAYLASFFVWNFAFRGFAFQYWWPEHPTLANQVVPIAAGCGFIAHGIFAIHYLQTRLLAPRLHRVLLALLALDVVCLLPPLAGFYAASYMLLVPVGLFGVAVSVWTGAVLWRRGSRPARYYLLAWFGLAVGLVLYMLRMLGVLPANALTEHGLQVGSALEFVLLAFGLADRMNQLEAEKLGAERAALEAKTALSEQLEHQVRERTQALEAANQRLAEMAITDELTGAYNRRHFNEVFGPELRRKARGSEGLALALLDVDHFKAYNDRYGHPQGDRALQAVSTAVRRRLQRAGDRFFRLGGEEFAVIFLGRDAAAAHGFVLSLCAEVARLALPHEGSPHGRVTISAGLLYLPPGSPHRDPQAVFARADALLYEAKEAGRHTVKSETFEPAP
ncbi:sensor domain-containing diguanylate cyclase [Eleftheria terrae]|uniref:sensor domain-containing diguanylate cyclase n=1 Tax=Eleftheria terrae TaxID=1597781 RepID=UPI00263A9C68|nr:diguanylate cyclase [Eleftheria terrae]WKB52177.1 sensor domain-containing diguanylate cyclase [Eleftheria terrae]